MWNAILTGMGKLLTATGKKITPTTVAQKAKELGIDLDKVTKGNKSAINKVLNSLGYKKPSLTTKAAIAGGGAAAGAYGKGVYDRLNKGGSVRKMKAGGSVRRMNKGGSVSRGTGAAIQGTKFKGVF